MGYVGADALSSFLANLPAGKLIDQAGTPKVQFNPTAKAITNASATALFTVARAANVSPSPDRVSGDGDGWDGFPDDYRDGDVRPRRQGGHGDVHDYGSRGEPGEGGQRGDLHAGVDLRDGHE